MPIKIRLALFLAICLVIYTFNEIMIVDIPIKQLKREVFAFLARSDCSSVTRKQVRSELERIHGARFACI